MSTREQYLTSEDVQKLLGVSRSGLHSLVSNKKFPRPIHLGNKLVRWRGSTVDRFIASQDQKLNAPHFTNMD